MPKSTAAYFGFAGLSISTKMLPGCMSAWKKLCLNTCVKKISTPFSARRRMSVPASRRRVMFEICTPWMRSITMTCARQKSKCTAGTYRRGEFSQLRRSCEALAASRIRSSSSMMVFSYSRTTSMGLRRRLPSQWRSAIRASSCSTSRSREITLNMSGRSTLTTTSRVLAPLSGTSGRNSATCTCAMDAAASGVSSKLENTCSAERP